MKVSFAANAFGAEEKEAVRAVMESGYLTMGKKVAEFEEAWADYIGVRHAVMVNSGSSANLIALASLVELGRLQPGDEVITPAVTWATTVWPIAQAGLVPVLVDVELDTFNIDIGEMLNAATEDVKALMPVHLLGNPASIGTLGMPVIEDACEAHGAEIGGRKVGSIGDVGTFSFYFSHHISTIEGGMLTTNDSSINKMARRLRAFGWAREEGGAKFEFLNPGYNVRPTEINAVLGLAQLPKLEGFLRNRKLNATYLSASLADTPVVTQRETPGTRHAWFAYPITLPGGCEGVVEALEAKGIETRPVMSGNIAVQPAMQRIRHRVVGDLPNAQRITRESFLIPCHESVTVEQLDYMVEGIKEFALEGVPV